MQSQLYARLVAANTRWFDYDGSLWFATDGQDGSARSAVYAASVNCGKGSPFVYTLECNYDSGVAMNELSARHASDTHIRAGRMSPEPPKMATTMGPKYCPESWRDVGKAMLLAKLDLIAHNPHSRLGAGDGGGLQRLRFTVSNTLAKYEKMKSAPRPPKEGDSAGEDDDVSSAYETAESAYETADDEAGPV